MRRPAALAAIGCAARSANRVAAQPRRRLQRPPRTGKSTPTASCAAAPAAGVQASLARSARVPPGLSLFGQRLDPRHYLVGFDLHLKLLAHAHLTVDELD